MFPDSRLGPAVSLDLIANMNCRTFPDRPNTTPLKLRFHLTDEQVKLLEDKRHTAPTGRLVLYLQLESIIVWLRYTGNSMNQDDGASTIGAGGWPPMAGMFAEMLPFWNTDIRPLQAEIEPSTWVDSVLPGLGYDHVRLVEIDLSQMPDVGILVNQFDTARREYDDGRDAACIAACRNIREAWEKVLEANKDRPVAKVLAGLLLWPVQDWHINMLNAIWKGYADMTNAFHHTPPPTATAADARFCLLLTAILSEYVAHLRK